MKIGILYYINCLGKVGNSNQDWLPALTLLYRKLIFMYFFPLQFDWLTYGASVLILAGLLVLQKWFLPAQQPWARAPIQAPIQAPIRGALALPYTTQEVPTAEEDTPGLQTLRVDPKWPQVRFASPPPPLPQHQNYGNFFQPIAYII